MLTKLEAGMVFAREYRVEGPLAEGGFGAVYRVVQITNGRSRALKILHAGVVAQPKMRERFEREARIGAMIDSEYVVEVSAAGVDEATGTPWLAMELLEGEDVAKLVERRGRLAPAEVLSILEDACDALGAAHAKHILHLDLKPENLFVAKKKLRGVAQVVKVLDFGIARITAENRMSATMTSGIGSWLWAAPEQAMKGGRVTPSSDVWALGVIAFHLLTGKHYWDAGNVGPDEAINAAAVLLEVQMSALPPPSERAAALGLAGVVPAGFDGWFARCVSRGERYANAAEAIEGLRAVLGETSATTAGVHATATLSDPPVAPALSTRASRTELMGVGGGHAAPSQGVPTSEPVKTSRSGEARVAALAAGASLLAAGSWYGLTHRGGEASPARPRSPAVVAVVQDAGPPPPRCPEGMDLVPAGEFMMGADGGADASTGHAVRLSAFCIDHTEVTVAAYRACAARGECPAVASTVEYAGVTRADHSRWDRFCNGGRTDRDTHPMNCVDWTSANAFCRAEQKELPTEAQWEYAARGTDGRLYPWGNQVPDETRLNACGAECGAEWRRNSREPFTTLYPGNDGWESTAPVGSYSAGRSPFGVLDMAGNVWEWTVDWHAEPLAIRDSSVFDPGGPTSGTLRVFRGGGWYDNYPSWVRASTVRANAVSYRNNGLGFRCARRVAVANL